MLFRSYHERLEIFRMKSGIHVCVRVKPTDNNREYWHISEDNKSISCDKMVDSKCFDYIFSPKSESVEIYEEAAKPIIENAFNGINGTILAYGQTGSGKTFTMSGTAEHPGIIVHAVNDIFDIIKKKASEYKINVYFSFYEIYCEKYRDLLVDSSESNSRQSFIQVKANDSAEILKLLQEGNERRSIGATKMNNQSSRSHALAKISLNIQPLKSTEATLVSDIFLVDLAGSECISDTEATGSRKIEAKNINVSLLSLSTVVDALVHNKPVSYSNSKLTKDLKNSLGGNSKTSIICTISGEAQQRYVSENTLRFASNAMKVKNAPKANRIVSDKQLIEQLKAEIISLQSKLASFENQVPYMEIQESRNRIEEITTTIFDEGRKSYSRLATPRKSYTPSVDLLSDLSDSKIPVFRKSHIISDDDNSSVSSEVEADRLCMELSGKVFKESKTEIINMDKIEIESLKEKIEKLTTENKELNEKLAQNAEDLKNKTENLENAQNNVNSLTTQVKELTDENSKQKEEILKLKEENTKIKEEDSKLKEEKRQADWEVSYYVKALTQLQLENDNLQNQSQKKTDYAEMATSPKKKKISKENDQSLANLENENKLANKILDILEKQEPEPYITDHVDEIIVPEIIDKSYYTRQDYYIPRKNDKITLLFQFLITVFSFILCVCVIVS